MLDIEAAVALRQPPTPSTSKTTGSMIRRVVVLITALSFTTFTLVVFLRLGLQYSLHLEMSMKPRKGSEKLSSSLHTITQGIGRSRALDGCITYYRASILSEQRQYSIVCLKDDTKQVQSLRLNPQDLGVPGGLVAEIGANTILTLFYEGKPRVSFFSNTEADLGAYIFEEMEITYIKHPLFSDSQQIIVELDGYVAVPSPCTSFSSSLPSPSALLICGAAGKDVVVLNAERLSDIGIDLAKLSREFSVVTMGNLATGRFESGFSGMSYELSARRGEVHDLTLKGFRDNNGKLRKLSEHLGIFKLSFS
jgi:hypothetical protein